MKYITLATEGISEFSEKKSRFIGSAMRVNSEEEAKAYIESIRIKHREARHNVFAYTIGQNMEVQRCSDDGEPQGTGGVPVLDIIKKNNIKDCVVVVTRYFGGILLGTGGLTRAYSKAALMAVNTAGMVEKIQACKLLVTCGYDLLGKLQYICGENSFQTENIEYAENIKMTIVCETGNIDFIKAKINEISYGKFEYKVFDEGIYYMSNNRIYKD